MPRAALTGIVSAQLIMAHDRLRRRVAMEAARLIYTREEIEYSRAKRKAGRRVLGAEARPGDLPSHREIREQVRALARRYAHEARAEKIAPPPGSAGRAAPQAETRLDRFHVYEMLLLPLERVRENPEHHPEGDALYHSLQVFELARAELPYDEEFLLAALLHDVGRAIDRREHIAAGLAALDGYVTPRTAWLIEHHDEALALRGGALGARSRRRLGEAEDFDELMLLAACDAQGRAVGVRVPDVREAIGYLRDLAESCGE